MRRIGITAAILAISSTALADVVFLEGADDSHFYYMKEETAIVVARVNARNAVMAGCRSRGGSPDYRTLYESKAHFCSNRERASGLGREYLCTATYRVVCTTP
jgi:hypothetical protein